MDLAAPQQRTRSAENREYVRSLLRQKQPAFSAALELAVLTALPVEARRDRVPFAGTSVPWAAFDAGPRDDSRPDDVPPARVRPG